MWNEKTTDKEELTTGRDTGMVLRALIIKNMKIDFFSNSKGIVFQN